MKKGSGAKFAHSSLPILLYSLAVAVVYSLLSVLRHNHFQSGAFDLGLYDQAVWNFGHGFELYNTVKGRIIFGDHLVLTLPLLSPLFYLWNNVRALLIVQAIFIAVSAIPMYFIALKRTGSRLASWTVMLLYSLFFGIQFGIFFDFHPILLGVSLLVFLVWSIEYRKKVLFIIFLLLSLLTQENMGLAVACVGMCLVFRKDRYVRNTALFLIVIGIIYSAVALKVTSSFSPIGYEYRPVFPGSLPEYFIQLFNAEEKRLTWLYSYSWFSFLPLFSPGSLLAVLTDLSQYYATGENFSRMWSPFMHHRAILSVFLSLGLLDILVFFSRWTRLRFAVCILLLLVAGVCQYRFHFALNKLSKPDYWKEEQWMKDANALLSKVPASPSIASQQSLVPHLSHRKSIFLIYPRQFDTLNYPCGQKLCWVLDYAGDPEYIVIDARADQWLTQTLETGPNWLAAIDTMEKAGKIQRIDSVGSVRLYRVDKNVTVYMKKP